MMAALLLALSGPAAWPARVTVSAQAAPPAAGPRVTPLPLPAIPGAFAIWGSTGQDRRGHLWFGVTAGTSAHLLELDPATGTFVDRGNVVDELQKTGVLRANEHQAKIHSRIVQGPNDYLYFASMDEDGESTSRVVNPTWGGHLWRLKLGTYTWEHLRATPEALIAVAGGDRFIYALGYFGQVLYRFDTRSSEVRQVKIGAVGGHVSRNIVADARGHVYVTRLTGDIASPGTVAVTLVELGADFTELRATPIRNDHYINPADGVHGVNESHGLIAFQEMADRSIQIVTHQGRRYRIAPPTGVAGAPPSEAAAEVTDLGWLHPGGPVYSASLFTADGRSVAGLSHTRTGYEWVTCDAATRCTAAPFVAEGIEPERLNRSSLYGSSTRDASGRHYVVGIGPTAANQLAPMILQVTPGR